VPCGQEISIVQQVRRAAGAGEQQQQRRSTAPTCCWTPAANAGSVLSKADV